MFVIRFYIRLVCLVTYFIKPKGRITGYESPGKALIFAHFICVFSILVISRSCTWLKLEKSTIIIIIVFYLLISLSLFTHPKVWKIEYRMAYGLVQKLRRKREFASKTLKK